MTEPTPDDQPDALPDSPAEAAPTPQAGARLPADESEREAEATIRSISRLEESN